MWTLLVIETLQQTNMLYMESNLGLSGLTNGNAHAFWIMGKHITHRVLTFQLALFAPGQTELVAVKKSHVSFAGI